MNTRMIPAEALQYFEDMIYLPMLITVLSQDRERLSGVRLTKPYFTMIDKSIKAIQADSQKCHEYLRKNKMKLLKGKSDEMFTEYIFLHNGYEDRRRYLNVRLKNRTVELLEYYFGKVML